RNEKELLRPDLDEEEVETPVRHVDQYCLVWRMRAAIPAEPGRQVANAECDCHHQPLELAERARRALGEDLLAGGVKGLAHLGRIHGLGIMPLHLDRTRHCFLLQETRFLPQDGHCTVPAHPALICVKPSAWHPL